MLNNPKVSIEKKMWAAKEAAPFVHSKLASVNKTISGDEDKPIAGQKYVCLSFVSPEDIMVQHCF